MFANGRFIMDYSRSIAIIKMGLADTIRIDKNGKERFLKSDSQIFLSDQNEADIKAELKK